MYISLYWTTLIDKPIITSLYVRLTCEYTVYSEAEERFQLWPLGPRRSSGTVTGCKEVDSKMGEGPAVYYIPAWMTSSSLFTRAV